MESIYMIFYDDSYGISFGLMECKGLIEEDSRISQDGTDRVLNIRSHVFIILKIQHNIP